MRTFVICSCVLTLFVSISAGFLAMQLDRTELSADDDVKACMTEFNITMRATFTVTDILNGEPAKPENQGKRQTHGCFYECVLKKIGVMEGSELNENKILTGIAEQMDGEPEVIVIHKFMRDCMRAVKNITEICEKGMSLMTCVVRNIHT